MASPTPHGVGGLKCGWSFGMYNVKESHPARGGWIEIGEALAGCPPVARVPPRTGWVD